MVRMTVCVVVVALVLPTLSTASDGPIESSAKRALASQPNNQGPAIARPGWFWGGLGMVAGGTVLSALGASALKTEDCAIVGNAFNFGFACVEEPNRAVIWSGVGVASVGSVFMWMGLSPSITFGPRRLAYTVRF